MVVLLGQGEVQNASCLELQLVLNHLFDDKALDHSNACIAVLTTATHLLARFWVYETFPARLWTLSRKYNKVEWIARCEEFLQLPSAELDQGYSHHLQCEALSAGSEYAALAHLTSSEVSLSVRRLVCVEPMQAIPCLFQCFVFQGL